MVSFWGDLGSYSPLARADGPAADLVAVEGGRRHFGNGLGAVSCFLAQRFFRRCWAQLGWVGHRWGDKSRGVCGLREFEIARQ